MVLDHKQESSEESKKQSAMLLLEFIDQVKMDETMKKKYSDAVLNLHYVHFIDMVMFTTFK